MSVFYRFVISAFCFLVINFILKNNLKFSPKTHFLFILQGVFNSSINYLLTYVATGYAPSAVVAMGFTTLVYMNMLGMKFYFKKHIGKNVLLGGAIGAAGIFLMFYDDLKDSDWHSKTFIGLTLSLIATLSASTGNMLSYKLQQLDIPVPAFSFWGMTYGFLFTGLVCLWTGESFSVTLNSQFVITTLYLSIVGTVLAFWSYFHLVKVLGAERASYTSIISPAIALTISSVLEDLHLGPLLLGGVLLCLIGNILTLKKRRV